MTVLMTKLRLAEWRSNLEAVLVQMAETVSQMYDHKVRMDDCPAATAGQILWIERSQRRYRWLEYRLGCMKMQSGWYETQIARLNGRAMQAQPVAAVILLNEPAAPSKHRVRRKNSAQFDRSAEDLFRRTKRKAGAKKSGKKSKAA